ncbi:MAG: hypothetical protein HYV29_08120 [Ignavibacteriales bacterium]|nr:hypothetical protein [Ignavibacteriales bacterium]
MLTPKYILTIASICSSMLFLPGIDLILSGVLIFMFGAISVIVNLFFFWGPLRKILFKELLSQFYLQLYHNDEFIDFLVEKRNARKNKNP